MKNWINIVVVASLLILLPTAVAVLFAVSEKSARTDNSTVINDHKPRHLEPVLAAEQPVPQVLHELPETQTKSLLLAPIDRPFERVLKKPFGLEILPGQSPVANDRFTGIHVGVDFEIFAGEEEKDIPVTAICEGPLRLKTFANGYGGVAIQTCELEGEEVSVIYGHLRLQSIEAEQEALLAAGDFVGYLGDGYSAETDGVRKHLHLGIRSGTGSDIRGYVKQAYETSDWYDVLNYLARS